MSAQIIYTEFRRFALPFHPAVVRAMVPRSVPGTYLLFDTHDPIYVGRSDRCMQTRLLGHPLLGQATHVSIEPARTSAQAFLLEAFWFHEFGDTLANRIHPGRPVAYYPTGCPFCRKEDIALQNALPIAA